MTDATALMYLLEINECHRLIANLRAIIAERDAAVEIAAESVVNFDLEATKRAISARVARKSGQAKGGPK